MSIVYSKLFREHFINELMLNNLSFLPDINVSKMILVLGAIKKPFAGVLSLPPQVKS